MLFYLVDYVTSPLTPQIHADTCDVVPDIGSASDASVF